MIDSGTSPVPYLARGQPVRFEYGALQGIDGILPRDQSGRERLTLSIELLECSLSLSIEADQVSVMSAFISAADRIQ
jgi:hypothetical protein